MNITSSSANIPATNNPHGAFPAPSVQSQPSFALRDFLKMLAAAILSGVGVSVVVVGLALMLANSADAGTLQKNTISNALSTQLRQVAPALLRSRVGGLYISGDRDREPVDAVERDWRVRIDDDTAEVRVKQTFLLPADEPTAAFYEASLPPNAKLIGLKAHAPQKILSGRVLATNDFTGMNRDELNKLKRHGVLIMWNDEGMFSTDQIINLIPNETVVIEYTYSVSTHVENGPNELNLTLSAQESEMFVAARPNLASGTIWVVWVGKQPKRLINLHSAMPTDVALEESAQGITGSSCFTPSLAPATIMKFTWEMDSPFSNPRSANR